MDPSIYTSILVPGSGTTAVESTLSSIRAHHKLAVFSNGVYGSRMAEIARIHRMPCVHIQQPTNQIITPELVKQTLDHDAQISHIALVHHETTSGILNPVRQIQHVIGDRPVELIVDAMSSFGGIPIDYRPDFLISSANKCLESVPGCAFVVAKKTSLDRVHKTPSSSLTGALYSQWHSLETTGQCLYTPPTNVIAALDVALQETLDETVYTRHARYCEYNGMIRERMTRLGFVPYLSCDQQGPIITSYRFPTVDFEYPLFHSLVQDGGVTLYNGSQNGMFRIGNIGHLSKVDIESALDLIERVVRGMRDMRLDTGIFDHTM